VVGHSVIYGPVSAAGQGRAGRRAAGEGGGGLLAAKEEEGGVFREVADDRSLLPAYAAFTAERGARRQGRGGGVVVCGGEGRGGERSTQIGKESDRVTAEGTESELVRRV